MDIAEFEIDYYPEYQRVDEVIVEPDGRLRPGPRRSCSDSYNQVKR